MKIDGVPVYHLVAKIERPDISLCEFEVGSWVWRQLRVAFPTALASCLMPDHPHVVSPLADPAAGQMRLNRLLGQLARHVGVRYLGEAPEPRPIADLAKLQLDLRYVALNPTRKRLVDDPLAWLFSTHRDVGGATVDPWVDARRLARVLRRPLRGFVDWYHHYVSADPSVDVGGTPAPRSATPTNVARYPLATIVRAVGAATRSRPESIRRCGIARDLFVGLAHEQGWSTDALAAACACSPRAVRRSATHTVDLGPARLSLGDRRLLRGVPTWGESISLRDSDRRPVGSTA